MGFYVGEMTNMRHRLLANVEPRVDNIAASRRRALVIEEVAMHLRYIADTYVEPRISRTLLGQEALPLPSPRNILCHYIRSSLPTASVFLTRLAAQGLTVLLGGGDVSPLLFVKRGTKPEQSTHGEVASTPRGGVQDVTNRGSASTTMSVRQR